MNNSYYIKVTWYDKYCDRLITNYGLVEAHNIVEATNKVSHRFNSIKKLSLKEIQDEFVFFRDSKQAKEVFNENKEEW